MKISPAQLRINLSQDSGNPIFKRGQSYHNTGRVISLQFNEEDDQNCIEITAKVHGSRTYKTLLLVHVPDSSIANYECSCPYDYAMCKHVVALGLTIADNLEKQNLTQPPTRIVEYSNVMQKINTVPIQTQILNKITLLRKLSEIGIDAHNLPETTIQELIANISKNIPLPLPIIKKPKPRKPFNERYYISIENSYDGLIDNARLLEVNSQSFYYYGNQDLDIKDILKNEKDLTREQIEMLEMLHQYHEEFNHNKEKQKTDLVKILCLARSCDANIKIARDYGNAEKLIWNNGEKLHVAISEEQRESIYGNYKYSVIKIDFSKSLSFKSCSVIVGDEGLIVIEKTLIKFNSMPFMLANIIGRAIKNAWRRSYEEGRYNYIDNKPKNNGAYADLLGSEYEHINNILTLFREYFVCDTKLHESYNITRPKALSIIIIDYESDKSILNILPSVDYGGVILAVCDINYFSNSKQNPGIARRNDPAFGVSHVVRITTDTICISPVALKAEKELFNLGREHSEELGIRGAGRGLYKGQKQITNFVQQYLPNIKKLDYEIVYPHDIPKEVIDTEFKADFDIDFSAENDWLAFDLALYCGLERVQLSDIEACLNNNDSQITMKDGRILRITNPEALKKLIELLMHFRKNNYGKYEGKSYHAPELEAVAKGSPHYTARASKAFNSFISEAKQGKLVKSLNMPKIFKSVLRNYQVDGVHWLHFLHKYKFAGVLADDMGLGKTLQALAVLSIHAKKDKPSLIIAPKTLLHNWEQEVIKFAPHLKTILIDGAQSERKSKIAKARKYDLIITSYPALQRDIEIYEQYKLCFNYCVLDEAQYVKNPHTKSSHIVRRVKSDYRLVLTGTPLENGVLELWSQFDFLMPGFLGHYAHFQKHIGNPIMKHSNQEALKRLRTKVQCFMLRRTKEKVLTELPPKIEQIVICELSDEQNILYQDVLKRVRNDITVQVKKAGFAASQIHILAGLTRLRQICNHPALVLPAKKQHNYPSVKLDECIEIIQEICKEKRKILVFSSFTKMLDIIARKLDQQKIIYNYLSGETKDRAKTIDSFNDNPNISVFLISIKTGGVGLNLISADTVVIFDPWWNPQVERQAIDRAHRIGQTKSVNVYRLRAKGTVEEKIVALQERKQKLFNALVDDSKDLFKKLTWEDVKSLLE